VKKKRTYTRKSYALRLISIIAVILLIGHFTGTYFFLPGQALDQLIKKEAVGEVEVITPLYDADLTPSPIMRYYLCANDDVLLLAGTRWHPLMGWYYEHTADVPLAGDDTVKACYQSFSRRGEETKMYVFGRVDDESVMSVCIEAKYYFDDIQDFRSVHMSIHENNFIIHDGKRYFLEDMSELLLPDETELGRDYNYTGIFVSALDKDGNAIPFKSEKYSVEDTETERMVRYYSFTSFG